MGWRLQFSFKTVCRATHIQKCSPGNVVSGSIRFMQTFAGVLLERGRQMRVGSFKMAIFASFDHCLPNILHTWQHDSFQII